MTGIRVRRVKLSFGIYSEILKSRREKIYEHPNTLGRLVFILNPSDRTPSLAVNMTLTAITTVMNGTQQAHGPLGSDRR